MCLLLAPVLIGFFSFLFAAPLTVLMKQTRQAVCAVKQSILPRCLWIMPTLFTFFTKQATLMRRSTVLSLPLQLVFPGETQQDLGFVPQPRQRNINRLEFKLSQSTAN
jgi:hypothetical protein